MSDVHPNAESGIVHELAGLLASIWSLAEIVENRPEHPDREQFISMLRQESRRAARTMKDWQMIRALGSHGLAQTVAPVWLHELNEPAEERSYDLAALGTDIPPVKADGNLLAESIERCAEVVRDLSGYRPILSVTQDGARVGLALPAGDTSAEELRDGLERGEGRTRALLLAHLILSGWGGGVRVLEGDAGTAVVMDLVVFD